LFYRVSVTTLRIPALRERKEDIAELVEHFNQEVSHRHGVSVKRFEANVIDAFERYAWPGNVREMRNVVEGMVMLADDDTVTAAQLPEEIAFLGARAGDTPHVSAESATVPDLDAVERAAISTAIARRQGNLTRVAKELQISKSTLYLKINTYGLNTTLRQARQHDR
jgi:transcriptional regulator with PAS, ATPase and Fis domain